MACSQSAAVRIPTSNCEPDIVIEFVNDGQSGRALVTA